jgi:hypothetical protein
MNETEELDQIRTCEARLKILKDKKRKNLDKMKRIKRSYVKAKLEKKRINREVKQLQKEWQDKIKNNPTAAKSAFAAELKAVSVEDVFPKDLEQEFDKIELKNIKRGRTMRTEDLSDDSDMRDMPAAGNAAEVLERELEAEMKDHDDAPLSKEAEEPDDDLKAQLDDHSDVGLTIGDLFIDEDGNEEEVTSQDEEK